MPILPATLATLVIFSVAFGMAAVPFLRCPNTEKTLPFGRMLPHPSQPGSMLTFVALPSFLILLSLARFGLMVSPIDSVNSPDSGRRILCAPRDVDVVVQEVSGTYRRSYPRNTAELTAGAAQRVGSGVRWQRIQALRDLAWWTGVCPNYGQFTMPRLIGALRDPDPAIKGAAAIGLGSTGGHGAVALPDLLAVRGTSVPHFDHLVAEAVLFIEHSPRWPPADECEDVPVAELERRAAQQGHAAGGRRDGNE